ITAALNPRASVIPNDMTVRAAGRTLFNEPQPRSPVRIMKISHVISFVLSLIAITLTTNVHAADAATKPPMKLRVMSFNLRFASNQQPNAWPDRRPVMKHVIEQAAPDVIGTQEGVYAQLRDLAADLPAYEWIGLGRAGGS